MFEMENSPPKDEQANGNKAKKYRERAFAAGIIILWLLIYIAIKFGFIKS
jgi:hypothetical protein